MMSVMTKFIITAVCLLKAFVYLSGTCHICCWLRHKNVSHQCFETETSHWTVSMMKSSWPGTDLTDTYSAVNADIERYTNRSGALSVSTQILTALRYFATGSFQRVDGDLHGVIQSSVSRCVNAVAKALSRHASQSIRFPTDEASQRRIKAHFMTQLASRMSWDAWTREADRHHSYSTENERAC